MTTNSCRLILKKVLGTRFLSLHSCNFARGSRFITPTATEVSRVKETTKTPLVSTQIGQTQNISKVVELDDDYSNKKESNKSTIRSFEKLQDHDIRFSSVMLALRSKKERLRRNQIVLEGQRLIQDALNAGVKAHSIFFGGKDCYKSLRIPVDNDVQLYKTAYRHIQLWSTVSTSSGLIGVFETPKYGELETLKAQEGQLSVTVVFDNMRDPGNLGSALRVAAGVGCKQVLLTKGCVDLWDPKVLRSGAGSHFRVPVIQDIDWDLLEDLVHAEKAVVYLADCRRQGQAKVPAEEYCEVNMAFDEPLVLVMGGETDGLSMRAQSMGTSRLYIPLAGGVDSLNVATALAVLLFEIRRQKQLNISKSIRHSHVRN